MRARCGKPKICANRVIYRVIRLAIRNFDVARDATPLQDNSAFLVVSRVIGSQLLIPGFLLFGFCVRSRLVADPENRIVFLDLI